MNNDSLTRKGWFLAIICFFLGYIGIHRFMVGKVGTGILYIFTGGLFGIGVLVDLIYLVMGKFTDSDGNQIPFGA